MTHDDVVRVAITGGPCAGKTTLLAILPQWLADRGFVAVTVPEGATDFIQSGMPPGAAWKNPVAFNANLVHYILEREDRFAEAARMIESSRPRVLLCDRGALDFAAYVPPHLFGEVLVRVGRKRVELLDRYAGVIHLVTAAEGAEEFYTCANNSARTETAEEARALDRKTRGAWFGSQHYRLIPNGGGFEGKINAAKRAVAHLLGIPVPLEIERKYWLRDFDLRLIPEDACRVSILQDYLLPGPSGGSRRVRQRVQNGGMTFFYTEKETVGTGVRRELERQIGEREYLRLSAERDPAKRTIFKDRYTFLHEGQYFELDVFRGHCEGVVLLEVELTEARDRVILPSFAAAAEDVTDRPEFLNENLARENPLLAVR